MPNNIHDIRVLLGHDPGNQALLMSLAKSLVDAAWSASPDQWAEYHDEARSIYESVIAVSPTNEVALVNLGTVLSDMGDHQQALQKYQLAHELGWEDANLEFNIGVAFVNLRNDERGIQYLKASHNKAKHAETWQAYFDPQAH